MEAMKSTTGRLKRSTALWGIIVAVTLVAMPIVVAAKDGSRSVRGKVVAVNVTDHPNVIVVKVMTASHKEMTVGATVGLETDITRGNERVELKDIKVGESVELHYDKNPDGLAARSIRVR